VNSYLTSNHLRGKNKWYRWLFWLVPLLFLGFFFYLPLVSIFKTAFGEFAQKGFSNLRISSILSPLGFTIGQALLSTALTLLVGLPAAYLFARYQFFGKRFLRILTTLPFILPTVVVAASFNTLFGAHGWVNELLMTIFHLSQPPLHVLNSLTAILLAHIFYNTTIVIRVVGSQWEQMNPRFAQAGRVLGASCWCCFKQITLPLLAPSILAASLLVFLFDFTSFGVILLLGGAGFATLEVEIFIQAMYVFNLPLAAVLAIIQMVCTLGMTIAISRLSGKWNLAMMPRLKGESTSPASSASEKWFVGLMAVLLLILFLSPLLGMVFQSVTQVNTGSPTKLTFSYYQSLFVNSRNSIFFVPPIQAVMNSILFATLTTVLSLTLGFLAAYALTPATKLSRVLEPFLLLPLGASAVTLGLGMIVVFNSPAFNLSSFPFLLPIAHSLVAFPFVLRTLQPALASIPPHLREAASTLGASPIKVWREVDLPILARAALVGVVFAFTISLGEFGATSFLTRPEFPTIPIAISRFLSLPGASNYGQALAMATILLVICAASIVLLESGQKQIQSRDSIRA
jgi:thiamine transport system permease protein